MNLFTWFKSKPVIEPETRLEIIQRDRSKLTLAEWRSSEPLVGEARKLLATNTAQVMMDVLSNEHPSGHVLPPNAPEHVRAAKQAQGEGYTMCLANLQAMAVKELPQQILEAEFGEPEFEGLTKGK